VEHFPQYTDDSRSGGDARDPAANLGTNAEAEAEIGSFEALQRLAAIAAAGYARALHGCRNIISMLINARAAGRGCARMKRKAKAFLIPNYPIIINEIKRSFRVLRRPPLNPFAQH
jgi:hypothetical protein